ncbi:MAG: phosphoenolpyruvate carboxylase [Candidatus Dormibacteria bacterium]
MVDVAEPPSPSPSRRDQARLRAPERVRREVRLLGQVLGRVIAGQGGASLLADVDGLRRAVIARRVQPDATPPRGAAADVVAGWSTQRAEEVARAFACYFHLSNLAEERFRSQQLDDGTGGEAGDSVESVLRGLADESGEGAAGQVLAGLRLHPVLTAHPTEARRRAVSEALRRVGAALDNCEAQGLALRRRQAAERRLDEEVDRLWRTSQVRSREMEPLDEVRTVMAVFDQTIVEAAASLYSEVDAALCGTDAGARPPLTPAFLRFGSWVGGDRDGNPRVTAAVTVQAVELHVQNALFALETATARVGRALTLDEATTAPSPEMLARLHEARHDGGAGFAAIEARSPGEPHRQWLLHVADRLAATRTGQAAARCYAAAGELVDDLRLAQHSLAAAGATRQAYGQLQRLIWQAETFGFHLTDLEIRQHSDVHRAALEEVTGGGPISPRTHELLATFRAIAELQQRHGVACCHRYVISFTRAAADVAAVHRLAALACPPDVAPTLDVVPLFESIAELRRAPAILDEVVELEPVRQRLEASGGEFEVMLGYSDSAKESGPVSAAMALHSAQADLAAWAARRGVRLTLFHGRGGALGRGGGPAHRAVMAQAAGSVAGRLKVTEQGEVISARYANAEVAADHLGRLTAAVLRTSTTPVRDAAARAASRHAALGERVGTAARLAYQELIASPGFAEFFAAVTPERELAQLHLGSRPARRDQTPNLESLRAIPWVFAWSQVRLNLPGWYGIGSGLRAAPLDELRAAYREWPLLNVVVDNAAMSLAKADRQMAAAYLELGRRPDLAGRILAEYDTAVTQVLAVTEQTHLLERQPELSWALELRAPYLDALSLLQLRALRTLRHGQPQESERELLQRLLLLTVNGLAAGLQNTG